MSRARPAATGDKGYLTIVLHAHLPFVRHPEHDEFLEEDWLYEAITETYIPLIWMFERLTADGVDFRLTMSVTPTLAAMLSDQLLQDRYLAHLDRLIELSEKELMRTEGAAVFSRLAGMYRDLFIGCKTTFRDVYGKNLVSAFRKFQDLGRLELITCAATHAYLPLMAHLREGVRAQIAIGVAEHERHFGRRPEGIWLPECGTVEGLDAILAEFGIKYFFTDTHGILYGVPRPRYGVYAPLRCPSGVAAFGRDMESAKQVWSSIDGYPGDFDYRDFYRDVGFDLDFDYIRPYIHHDGIRIQTGIKYYRITGKTNYKEPYNPDWARGKAEAHAGNFMFNREKQIEHLAGVLRRPPIIIAPYDAELFGHWWFEGPLWIEFLFRKLAAARNGVRPITPSEYLARHPRQPKGVPADSSWGWKGYNEVWLQQSNDWIYRHVHAATRKMTDLAKNFPDPDPGRRRALNQAARELLLAQSSDWAFILQSGSHEGYALRRTKEHLLRFWELADGVKSGQIDHEKLADWEGKDNLFPHLDYRVFA